VNNRVTALLIPSRSVLPSALLIVCSLGTLAVAKAEGPIGLYIGAAYGQAHIRVQPGEIIPQSTGQIGGLDMTHSAFKGMLGVRMLHFFGAEVAYMDFGKVSSLTGQPVPGLPATLITSEQASQKGEAAFAMLYLPVPIIDIYVKAGLSRITTDFAATYTFGLELACKISQPTCNVANVAHDSTDTAFAYGAGVQWKLGDWAVRGEYERFSAAGANPSYASIGMTYWLPLP
jgi:opacity protein-like surface antigen